MEKDCLKILNFKLAEDIMAMNDDELWDFIQVSKEIIEHFYEINKRLKTIILNVYRNNQKNCRNFFLEEMEDDRDSVLYTLILDFCLSDEEIILGYKAMSGYLDNADSCCVKTSDEFMPSLDEDSMRFFYTRYFHLLEINHVENIIAAMEKNSDQLTINTPDDIEKIKEMRNFCLKSKDYKVVYIYDV